MATDAEIIRALEFISKTQRDAFHGRRNYEWKIFLSVLTLDVLSAGAKLKVGLDLSMYAGLVWFAYLSLALISSIFLLYVQSAHHFNKCSAHKAEWAILDIIRGGKPSAEHMKLYTDHERWFSLRGLVCVGKGGVWAWFWQTVLLVIFGIAAAVLVNAKQAA